MKEKIKVLSVGSAKKQAKSPKGSLTVQDYIEQLAPGTYTFSKAYVDNAVEVVGILRPEIIWIHQDVTMDCSELVKYIKRIQPTAVIFMMFIGLFDDEQEMMNTYLELGVYKCYFIPPMMPSTLVHDMHVALNLE